MESIFTRFSHQISCLTSLGLSEESQKQTSDSPSTEFWSHQLSPTSMSSRSSFSICFPGSDTSFLVVSDSESSQCSSPRPTKRVRIVTEPTDCVVFEVECVFLHAQALNSPKPPPHMCECEDDEPPPDYNSQEDLDHLKLLIENTTQNSRPQGEKDKECRIDALSKAELEQKKYLSCFKTLEEIIKNTRDHHLVDALEPLLKREKTLAYKEYFDALFSELSDFDQLQEIIDWFSPQLSDCEEDDDDWGDENW